LKIFQPELLGKSCFEFIHTEDQNHMKENFEQVVKMKGQVMTLHCTNPALHCTALHCTALTR
jgi:hypothetical protein